MAFFDENKQEEAEEQINKFKIGEEEFTEDELSGILGKYKKLEEVEKEHGDLDNIVSNYGRRANEIGDLKKQLEEAQSAKDKKAENDGEAPQPLTRSEIEEVFNESGVVTTKNFTTFYNQMRSAEKLIGQCSRIEKKHNPYEAEELPEFKTQEMLEYMDQNRITDPEKAYKLRYEKEIDEWKSKQYSKAKPQAQHTEGASTPGAKEPAEVKIDGTNLKQILREHLDASARARNEL